VSQAEPSNTRWKHIFSRIDISTRRSDLHEPESALLVEEGVSGASPKLPLSRRLTEKSEGIGRQNKAVDHKAVDQYRDPDSNSESEGVKFHAMMARQAGASRSDVLEGGGNGCVGSILGRVENASGRPPRINTAVRNQISSIC
jgi:hypothetical protein